MCYTICVHCIHRVTIVVHTNGLIMSSNYKGDATCSFEACSKSLGE